MINEIKKIKRDDDIARLKREVKVLEGEVSGLKENVDSLLSMIRELRDGHVSGSGSGTEQEVKSQIYGIIGCYSNTYVLDGEIIKSREMGIENMSSMDVLGDMMSFNDIVIEDGGYAVVFCSEESYTYFSKRVSGFPNLSDRISIFCVTS